MSVPPLSGRPSLRLLLAMLAVVAAGWAVGRLMERAAPVGIDLSGEPALRLVSSDAAGPIDTVSEPTLTLVVFSDYRCPACRAAWPALSATLAADGHVRVIHRDWPIFGVASDRAARVAIAADRQGIHPALNDALLREARPLDDAVLRQAVEGAGGDWKRLTTDLSDRADAVERRLAANRAQAAALRLPGTPAYLAGPILLVGAADEATFRRLFARARARAVR